MCLFLPRVTGGSTPNSSRRCQLPPDRIKVLGPGHKAKKKRKKRSEAKPRFWSLSVPIRLARDLAEKASQRGDLEQRELLTSIIASCRKTGPGHRADSTRTSSLGVPRVSERGQRCARFCTISTPRSPPSRGPRTGIPFSHITQGKTSLTSSSCYYSSSCSLGSPVC